MREHLGMDNQQRKEKAEELSDDGQWGCIRDWTEDQGQEDRQGDLGDAGDNSSAVEPPCERSSMR